MAGSVGFDWGVVWRSVLLLDPPLPGGPLVCSCPRTRVQIVSGPQTIAGGGSKPRGLRSTLQCHHRGMCPLTWGLKEAAAQKDEHRSQNTAPRNAERGSGDLPECQRQSRSPRSQLRLPGEGPGAGRKVLPAWPQPVTSPGPRFLLPSRLTVKARHGPINAFPLTWLFPKARRPGLGRGAAWFWCVSQPCWALSHCLGGRR